jgi:hypothetical protein
MANATTNVAIDNSAALTNSTSSSPYTYAGFTVTGSNPYLVIGVGEGDTSGTLITGITYNGVAMTELVSISDANTNTVVIWGLANPATGSHDIVITFGAGTIYRPIAVSYTGVASAIDGSYTYTSGGGGVSSVSLTQTTTIVDDWMVGYVEDMGDSASTISTAGANTYMRQKSADSQHAIIDSNVALSIASHTIIANFTASSRGAGVSVALSPVPAATTPGFGTLIFFGDL